MAYITSVKMTAGLFQQNLYASAINPRKNTVTYTIRISTMESVVITDVFRD
jgi:hypothetical protein